MREPHSATGGAQGAYNGRGGKEYSEGRRSMPNDQTVKDATRLLGAFSTNHAEARMVSPHGMDRPFYPSWADAEQAGLDRVRRDAAIRWLVEKNMLESEGSSKTRWTQGRGFTPNTVRCSGSPMLGGSYWKRSWKEGRRKRSLRFLHGGPGGVGCS